jgi:tRNA (cytidine32/guanosine34-2'-O)-methyltransferase
LDPVQPPIAPPYKRALEMKKASSHGVKELEKLSLDS